MVKRNRGCFLCLSSAMEKPFPYLLSFCFIIFSVALAILVEIHLFTVHVYIVTGKRDDMVKSKQYEHKNLRKLLLDHGLALHAIISVLNVIRVLIVYIYLYLE
jgi:predicted esterase